MESGDEKWGGVWGENANGCGQGEQAEGLDKGSRQAGEPGKHNCRPEEWTRISERASGMGSGEGEPGVEVGG